MRFLVATIFLSLTVAGFALAESINPLDLIGQRSKPFVDPEGFYRAVFPSGFDCKAEHRRVDCTGTRGNRAKIFVVVDDVPASATPELMLLNEMGRYKKKLHFKDLGQEKFQIRGIPAVAATFSYDYLGNVEYPVGVKAVYLVQSGKLYVIHFESHLRAFPTYKDDLGELYRSFHPTKLDAGGNPILSDLALPKENGKSPEVLNSTPHGW